MLVELMTWFCLASVCSIVNIPDRANEMDAYTTDLGYSCMLAGFSFKLKGTAVETSDTEV